MTKVCYVFPLNPDTSSNILYMPATADLPTRITPTAPPATMETIIRARGGVFNFNFQEGSPDVYSSIDNTDRGGMTSASGNQFEYAGRVDDTAKKQSVLIAPGLSSLKIAHDGAWNFNYTNDWTIDLWIQPQSLSSLSAPYVQKYDGTVGWVLKGTSVANEFVFEIFDNVGNTLSLRVVTPTNIYTAGGGVGGFGSEIRHVTVVINANPTGLTPGDVRMFYEGVELTKIVDMAGPVFDFQNTQTVESGVHTGNTNASNYFDNFAMANQAWSPAYVQEVHEIGIGLCVEQYLIYSFTPGTSSEIQSITVPGRFGNSCLPECIDEQQVRMFYSINSGPQTQFYGAIANLTEPISNSDVLEIRVEFCGTYDFEIDKIPYIGGKTSSGPIITFEDNQPDPPIIPPVSPPPVPGPDSQCGVGGELTEVLWGCLE